MAKAPLEIKSLARTYTHQALNTLAHIMREPTAPHAARVMASNSLLDRGWGKPAQTISGDAENPLTLAIKAIERVIVDPTPIQAKPLETLQIEAKPDQEHTAPVCDKPLSTP